MSRFRYHCGSKQDVVELDASGIRMGAAEKARGYKWDFDLGARSASNRVRRAREVKVKVWAVTLEAADRLRDAVDADMAAGAEGRLEIDGWSQRCVFVEMELESINRRQCVMEWTVALLDGIWGRETTVEFAPGSGEASGDWLDFPHPYPYDFASPAVTDMVSVASPSGNAPVRLVVYGPATNPYVTIGANLYQWVGTVPSGGYLDIDARSGRKTIRLVRPDGSVQDAFSGGVRQGGLGGGSYVFQPLRPGLLSVSWPRSFGFDLTYVEQSATPPFARR